MHAGAHLLAWTQTEYLNASRSKCTRLLILLWLEHSCIILVYYILKMWVLSGNYRTQTQTKLLNSCWNMSWPFTWGLVSQCRLVAQTQTEQWNSCLNNKHSCTIAPTYPPVFLCFFNLHINKKRPHHSGQGLLC